MMAGGQTKCNLDSMQPGLAEPGRPASRFAWQTLLWTALQSFTLSQRLGGAL